LGDINSHDHGPPRRNMGNRRPSCHGFDSKVVHILSTSTAFKHYELSDSVNANMSL